MSKPDYLNTVNFKPTDYTSSMSASITPSKPKSQTKKKEEVTDKPVIEGYTPIIEEYKPIIEGYKPQLRNRIQIMPVQETVQAETVSTPTVQQTTPSETKQEISSAKKGKRYSNQQDFVKDMTEVYTKALASRGISTDYAKMLVAQDALESNWGKSSLAEDFNFGGIKAVAGAPFVEKETNEYDTIRGMHKTKAKFRKFDSLEDYANYKINLLSGKRYQAFTGDTSQFYHRIKAGGYATDPNYVSKLTNIYNSSVFSAKQGGSMPSRIDMLVAKFNEQFNK